MWEPGLAIWRELACNVVRKSNFLRRKPIIDLAYLVDHVIRKRVPLHRAIQDGATDITVVLTHNPAFRLKPVPRWMGKLAYPEWPMVARVWTARQNVHYNAALDLMKQPPAGIRIRVFRPLKPLAVGSFTIEQKRIAAALALGHDEAFQQMAEDAEPLGGSISK
jgi:predicted patatin/cPLA2 family phospholipase